MKEYHNVTIDPSVALTIVPKIEVSWIITAALKNYAELLTLLLKKYQGPMRFFNDMIDLITDENLKTDAFIVLLQHGCDPNTKNYLGHSLLMIACEAEDERRVRALLDHGANVNEQQIGGKIAAYHANQDTGQISYQRKGDQKAILLNHDVPTTKNTSLHRAVGKGNATIAKLISKINAIYFSMASPLFCL